MDNMHGLLDVISEYDRDQQAYIRKLEVENLKLEEKNAELVEQLASYVQTVDRMKLDLIMSGALKRPETTPQECERGERGECEVCEQEALRTEAVGR